MTVSTNHHTKRAITASCCHHCPLITKASFASARPKAAAAHPTECAWLCSPNLPAQASNNKKQTINNVNTASAVKMGATASSSSRSSSCHVLLLLLFLFSVQASSINGGGSSGGSLLLPFYSATGSIQTDPCYDESGRYPLLLARLCSFLFLLIPPRCYYFTIWRLIYLPIRVVAVWCFGVCVSVFYF